MIVILKKGGQKLGCQVNLMGDEKKYGEMGEPTKPIKKSLSISNPLPSMQHSENSINERG